MTLHHGGFPIRKSTDRSLFAAPRGLSQLVASFIGSWCQGIPLVLLFAWTFHSLFDLCCSLELLEFHKQIFIGIHIAVKRFILFPTLNHFHLSVKLYLPIFGKTKFILTIANLKVILSSKSVRFYSSISLFGFQWTFGRSGWTRTIDLTLIRRAL